MVVASRGTSVGIPWAAYFGDTIMDLPFPEDWDVRVYPSTDGEDIGEAGIARAFADPIGTPRIADLARGKRTASIVVDDLSRPTPAERLVPRILAELEEAGITRDRVTIICGVANHRQMMREDFVKKLGDEVVRTVRVVNHFSWDRCDYIGTTSGGIRVSLNRDFLAGEVKILVGGVFPHMTPGFGGGAKLVVPGVASIDTCYDLHGPNGPATALAVDASAARLQMEEAARMAGVSAIVNTVPTSRRGIAGLVVGDVVEAHRAAVTIARTVFATPIPREAADVGVFSAYPKDSEYLQIGMAFNVWRTARRPLVHDGGTVVACSAASEGPGFHSLIGPERRVPASGGFPASVFAPRDVAVFAPGVHAGELTPEATEGLRLHRRWDDLIDEISEKHGRGTRVAVYPWSSIQLTAGDAAE
jgi:nickel-dependent lactate racemase